MGGGSLDVMVGTSEEGALACPHCGGGIKAAAKICKHCRRSLEARLADLASVPGAQHRKAGVRRRWRFAFAVMVALVGIVVLAVVLRASKNENAGLWKGVCPAKGDKILDEVKACHERSPSATTMCGRHVVAEHTGNNEHYKDGDRLDSCFLCGQFIEVGLYPAEKGASECVSSRWMESDEFKKLQRVFYPGSR